MIGLVPHMDTSSAVFGADIKARLVKYEGGDDKAGIAEIITLAERLMTPDAPPHGKIRIAFTPDEEISGAAGHALGHGDRRRQGYGVSFQSAEGALAGGT